MERVHVRPGSRVGAYEVVALLGAGGMGEVYRARDARLERDVALKILPPAWADDADRLARFKREAQILASLNHPNIAAIHGLETSDGVHALVLELVEGPTLADLIATRSCDALPIARQLVSALDAAHQHGVIHRDLKPANIKVRPDGTVKVLDFGLAKALDPSGSLERSAAPTITSPAMTAAGVILGSAAYMSPEQAKGRAADKRTDIWAFGSVLYEMLTGQRAFGGDTVTEALAGVIRGEPDWSLLPVETSDSVRRLLRRCLDKDPARRLRDIADATVDLEDRADVPTSPARARGLPLRERLVWAAALGLVVIGAVAAVWMRGAAPLAAPQEVRLDISTPPSEVPGAFAISPDGQKVVYAATTEGMTRLWLRTLDSVTPTVLPGTNNGDRPFWSPDSRSVAFFADGRLRRVDISGGTSQPIAPALSGIGGTWNADDVIVFVASAAPQPLLRVAAGGGTPVPVETTRPLPQQTTQQSPQFLPDGQRLLYRIDGPPDVRGTYVAGLDSGSPKRLVETAAMYTSGRLITWRQGTLFSQAFDLVRLEPGADLTRIANAVNAFTVSSAGSILYRSGAGNPVRRLMWVDRTGKDVTEVAGGSSLDGPDLSPDERRIAGFRTIDGNVDVWVLEERGVQTRFTVDISADNFPFWSPDGSRLMFSSTRMGGPHNLFWESASNSGEEELVIETPEVKLMNDWSADGRFVIFRSANPLNGYDLWAASIEDRKPFPVLNTQFSEREAQFSPDAKWIAYQSDESGRFEIYIQPFPGPGRKWQVSTNGGGQVRWRRDGRELFYIAMDGTLMAVAVRVMPDGSLESDTPVPLFPARIGSAVQAYLRQQYEVSRDGQRFLMNRISEEAVTPPLTVILNSAVLGSQF